MKFALNIGAALLCGGIAGTAIWFNSGRTAPAIQSASQATRPAAAQIPTPSITLHDMYADDLRSAFFTAFLSLGGFLLALQTFIIVKMKESVYDHPAYVGEVIKMRELTAKFSHYGPLSNLSNLLSVTTLACFVCALLQFTLGFSTARVALPICIGWAVFTIYFLFTSLALTWWNLRDMFKFIEEESQKKHTPGNSGD